VTKILDVYGSKRSLILLALEITLVSAPFFLTAILVMGPDTDLALIYENGWLKIGCITVLTLLLNYYFDLYEPRRISEHWEIYFRLLLVLSVLAFVLAGLIYVSPGFDIGHNVIPVGLAALSIVLILWRSAYSWVIGLPLFRERVYVLGYGNRARTVVEILQFNRDAGMHVVGCGGGDDAQAQLSHFAADLISSRRPQAGIDRVIVALEDRREALPIRQLLDLRLCGVVIEYSSTLVERLSGRLPLESLYPSTMIFSEGFRVKASQQLLRRVVSFFVSLVTLLLCLPFIPFIILAVRLSSPGPVFFRQTRVGQFGRLFTAYKFRTMRQDAESNGAVWAKAKDPRVTPLGRFMRKCRLDEIPQLWNVLRGDMTFVGPRPERPEFVKWLSQEIAFYDLRHMIRPGLTGWAQVRFQYGASLEETKKKLEYDLFYIKHQSLGLDLLIMAETIKTIVLRRGAQ
jgi:sugar transferase (PEP-CTERM system associated)